MSGPSPELSVSVDGTNISVLLPITKAVESSDISVPSIEIPAAPALSVVPARAISEGKSVIGSVPIVMTGGDTKETGGAKKGIVELPTIISAESAETIIEATEIAGLFKVSVWEPTMITDGLRTEAGSPAMVKGGTRAAESNVFWLLRGKVFEGTTKADGVGMVRTSLPPTSGSFAVVD